MVVSSMEIKNYRRKFRTSFILRSGIWSFLFLATCYILLAPSSSAWVIGDPIVPCGPNYTDSSGATVTRDPCTQCELLHLVDNLMDFILVAAAPILATFFFLVAGVYIMLGGAKPDMLATGKRIFSSALIGIIIVMLAWLITNTLITTLIAPTLTLGNMPFNSADWWQLYCGTINLNPNPPGSGNQPLPPPPPPPPNLCSPALTTGRGARIDNFDVQPRTISGGNRNVNITFRVTANQSLILNSCGSTANNSFYWTIFESLTGGDRIVRECINDSRGCPTVTSNHQCFNIDFSTTLVAPVANPPISRTFYAFIECNNAFGNTMAQSANVTIQEN